MFVYCIGSPFHPRVVDARKVRAKGDWQSNLDTEKRIALKVNEMKRLMFDVTEAGPGKKVNSVGVSAQQHQCLRECVAYSIGIVFSCSCLPSFMWLQVS